MKHIDLFSGIGGFALAVDTVWPGSEHIFCDNDPFCQQVLKKHWPNSKIYGDIRTLTNSISERLEGGGGQPELQKPTKITGQIELLTGGFPCQPFSQAGRRAGTADDRYLWPEMFRVIREFKPTWVIAENVRGLLTWNEGLVLEQVCADLESEGYEVQPLIIPAVAVNAPHRRDRIWFIAHSSSTGARGDSREIADERRRTSQSGREGIRQTHRQTGTSGIATTDTNATNARSQKSGWIPNSSRQEVPQDWNRSWTEVAAELCGVDDGPPAELDGFKLSKAGHRRERLKSLGNAIVPQVAIAIMKAITPPISKE